MNYLCFETIFKGPDSVSLSCEECDGVCDTSDDCYDCDYNCEECESDPG